MKKIRVIKLSDNRFNGLHPNGIHAGYIKSGEELAPPTIGEPYWVGIGWRTSPVTKIINSRIFETENSTYKIEYL